MNTVLLPTDLVPVFDQHLLLIIRCVASSDVKL